MPLFFTPTACADPISGALKIPEAIVSFIGTQQKKSRSKFLT
jgi:hypothetical protein